MYLPSAGLGVYVRGTILPGCMSETLPSVHKITVGGVKKMQFVAAAPVFAPHRSMAFVSQPV